MVERPAIFHGKIIVTRKQIIFLSILDVLKYLEFKFIRLYCLKCDFHKKSHKHL